MLSLPYPPRRSHLRGFWLVLACLISIFYVIATLQYGNGLAMRAGGVVLFGVIAIGVIWLPLTRLIYRIWFLAARQFSVISKLYVAALIYFFLLPAAGRSSSALVLADPQSSMWRSYRGRKAAAGADYVNEKWFVQLVRESRMRGRKWWLPLLLPLVVLSLFLPDENEGKHVSENIYTLF